MGSVNEAYLAGSPDPPKDGHQFMPAPEADGPRRTSSVTHSICSNRVYGTLSTSSSMIQDEQVNIRQESVRAMVLQILISFLLAGFGTVMAGTLLDLVQVNNEKLGRF